MVQQNFYKCRQLSKTNGWGIKLFPNPDKKFFGETYSNSKIVRNETFLQFFMRC